MCNHNSRKIKEHLYYYNIITGQIISFLCKLLKTVLYNNILICVGQNIQITLLNK